MAVATPILPLFLAFTIVSTDKFMMGDSKGSNPGINYTEWEKKHRPFHVSDSRTRPQPPPLLRRIPPAFCLDRLPFELSNIRDLSSLSSQVSGFSAFIRAYFHFLDLHSHLPSYETGDHDENSEDSDRELRQLERLQALHLLMQIHPYTNGMEVGLILEAMDCIMIEIFKVYSGTCNDIACFLVRILKPSTSQKGGKEQERYGSNGG